MLASYLWTRHCRRQSKTELIIAVLLLFYRQQAVSAQLHLHVGYITTDSGAYVSNGTIPAVDLAVKQVNEVFNDFQLVLNRDGSPRSISVRLSNITCWYNVKSHVVISWPIQNIAIIFHSLCNIILIN